MTHFSKPVLSATKAGPRKAGRVLLAAMACLVIAACGKSETKAPQEAIAETVVSTAGQIESASFGLVANAPTGSYVVIGDDLRRMFGIAVDIAAGDNAQLSGELKKSIVNTHPIAGIFRHDVSMPSSDNPNVLIMAEDVSVVPAIKSGGDYLTSTRTLMSRTAASYEFDEAKQAEMIGGRSFERMDVTINVQGVTKMQRYYARKEGKYILCLIVTLPEDPSSTFTDDILASVRFNDA